MRITEVTTAADIEDAKALFSEYHEWLGEVVCSRSLGQETAELPGVYAPPGGRLLIARGDDGAALGIIGVRPFAEGICEIKRLFVRPAARGKGVGRELADAALAAARAMGYEAARLTTLPDSMGVALAFYREQGFVEVEPFYDHSHVAEGIDMLFMELEL